MRLSGLSLNARNFSFYLPFLTEVLEWDLLFQSEQLIKFNYQNTLIELMPGEAQHGKLQFDISSYEFEELKRKISFHLYRHSGTSIFWTMLPLEQDNSSLSLTDPDGRLWVFHCSKCLN
jgi:hypothetical protein